ncbi:cation-translocating P-type ATPase [Demequina rhizosphaerae]|uniref:cation-translocating P-type ATPase n=1 Tax=Demequina rhizosphaerae TaxID=1638985 RepID=UPI000784E60F|nr:cation-transporting P-type ATPase [Demequina rhizosphaerae]
MAAAAVTDPSTRDAAEVALALDADLDRGLTRAEAAARLERDGPNRLEEERAVPAWRRLLSQFADPLVYLLLAAALISLVAWSAEGAEGVPYDVLVIMVVVLANAALGFIQERRSAQAVAALQRMAAASAAVIRDGGLARVSAFDVVVGDLLVLAEGDAVPADARLVDGTLWAAEAPLTGESTPVAKSPAPLAEPAEVGDRTSMVFAGTAITRGTARAVVTATAMDTETGRVARLLGATESDPTPLEREIARLGRVLGLGVLGIAAVIVATVALTQDISSLQDGVDVLLLGVALAVAAVPEGLPAIMSVVLALGVQRMARRNAIVKDLASVETLGSASVICSDKTGTLTQNRMAVTRLVTADGTAAPGEAARVAREAVAFGALASDATVAGDGGFEGDPTEVAFLEAERELEAETLRSGFDRVDSVSFSSERRRMSVLATHDERADVLAVKGAPDVVLARCARVRTEDGDVALGPDRRAGLDAAIDALADDGMRTLAVAIREAPASSAREEHEADLTLLGVVGLEDPPRDEARAAVAEAQAAGIRVVMITGDHPRTASAIAAQLGIVPPGSPALAGAALSRMDDAALAAAVRDASVFARVAPEHKLRIVDALQAHGEVVAMTGDGVNDAPALRSADIGVAMGRGGTEVAREAANMILTDDDFATIVEAVREGRGILDNITRFLRFLIASNLGEVLAVFLGVVLAGWLGLRDASGAVVAPLLATQILWINLLTDLAPALAVSAEPYADDLMERRPRRPGSPMIGRRMWTGMAFTGAVMAAVTLITFDLFLPGGLLPGSSDLDTARTAAFTVLVMANLTVAFAARSETRSTLHRLFSNPWLWGAVGLSLALQVAVVHLPVLNDAFSTAPLTLAQWGQCAALAAAVPLAIEVRKAVLRSRDRAAARG